MTEGKTTADRAEKILKILAKAESTDNPHEAETFFQQAAALQARWEIDDAMLRDATAASSDNIHRHDVACTGTYAIAVQELAFAVGEGKGFKLLTGGSGNQRRAVWIGFEQDTKDAEVLFTSLLIQQAHAVKAYMRTWEYDRWSGVSESMQKFKDKRSFMLGFAQGVKTAMLEARAEAAREAAKARAEATGVGEDVAAKEVGLVLVSKQEEVEQWYEENVNARAARRTRGVDVTSAIAPGRAAGRAAALGGRKELSR